LLRPFEGIPPVFTSSLLARTDEEPLRNLFNPDIRVVKELENFRQVSSIAMWKVGRSTGFTPFEFPLVVEFAEQGRLLLEPGSLTNALSRWRQDTKSLIDPEDDILKPLADILRDVSRAVDGAIGQSLAVLNNIGEALSSVPYVNIAIAAIKFAAAVGQFVYNLVKRRQKKEYAPPTCEYTAFTEFSPGADTDLTRSMLAYMTAERVQSTKMGDMVVKNDWSKFFAPAWSNKQLNGIHLRTTCYKELGSDAFGYRLRMTDCSTELKDSDRFGFMPGIQQIISDVEFGNQLWFPTRGPKAKGPPPPPVNLGSFFTSANQLGAVLWSRVNTNAPDAFRINASAIINEWAVYYERLLDFDFSNRCPSSACGESVGPGAFCVSEGKTSQGLMFDSSQILGVVRGMRRVATVFPSNPRNPHTPAVKVGDRWVLSRDLSMTADQWLGVIEIAEKTLVDRAPQFDELGGPQVLHISPWHVLAYLITVWSDQISKLYVKSTTAAYVDDSFTALRVDTALKREWERTRLRLLNDTSMFQVEPDLIPDAAFRKTLVDRRAAKLRDLQSLSSGAVVPPGSVPVGGATPNPGPGFGTQEPPPSPRPKSSTPPPPSRTDASWTPALTAVAVGSVGVIGYLTRSYWGPAVGLTPPSRRRNR